MSWIYGSLVQLVLSRSRCERTSRKHVMWDLRCVGSSEGFQHSSCGRAISGNTASRNQNLSTEK